MKLIKRIKKVNLFVGLIFIFALYQHFTRYIKNDALTGKGLIAKDYNVLDANQGTLKFPEQGSRFLTIFWASWCGPCKLEMKRLASSVNEGKISRDKIVAINPFESEIVVRKFLSENSYPFIFLAAPELATTLSVEATPTTVFIEDQKVKSLSSGMSLWGIWKAELFLSEN